MIPHCFKKLFNYLGITVLTVLAWTALFMVLTQPQSSVTKRKEWAKKLNYSVFSRADTVEIVEMPRIFERRDIRGLSGCVQRKPDVLMIGVPKCGTGSVRTFLSEHPDIAMEMNSEGVQYFNARYQRGWMWYLSQMPCSEPGQLTAENSPQYFVSQLAPERVSKFNPNMKLIVTVRDPVKRLESEFMQMVVGRPQYLTGDTVEENVINFKTGEVAHTKAIVAKSVYILYLKYWLQYFNASQIHIVDGDEFAINPVKELTEIEKFLGVRNFFTKEQFAFVESRGFYCLRRWHNVECLEGGKGRQHPYISSATLQKLKDYYRPFNEELVSTFNKKFAWD